MRAERTNEDGSRPSDGHLRALKVVQALQQDGRDALDFPGLAKQSGMGRDGTGKDDVRNLSSYGGETSDLPWLLPLGGCLHR